MGRRKRLGKPVGCGSPFSSKIVCGDCGGFYGPKVWNSNTKYRRVIWRCNDKYGKDHKCRTPHLTEDQIKQEFLVAFNKLMENRDELLDNCRLAQEALCDCTEIDSRLAKLQGEMDVVGELTRKAIQRDACASDAGEVTPRSANNLRKLRRIKEKMAALETQRADRQGKAVLIQTFIREIEGRELVLDAFDERLWVVAVESITVQADGRMDFEFRMGV